VLQLRNLIHHQPGAFLETLGERAMRREITLQLRMRSTESAIPNQRRIGFERAGYLRIL
jgi:hypothetical protein